jgi:hypothetical protein
MEYDPTEQAEYEYGQAINELTDNELLCGVIHLINEVFNV